MKFHVNLYHDDLKPRREQLGLPVVLAAWALAMFVILCWKLWLDLEAGSLQKKQQQLSGRVTRLIQQVDVMTRQLKQRQPSASLQQQKRQLTAEVTVKSRLKSRLKDTEVLKQSNFSRLMQELAENHEPALWLQQITLDRQSLVLKGFTRKSGAVPRWVNRLQQVSDDGRYQFSSIALSRDEQQRLNFVLTGQ